MFRLEPHHAVRFRVLHRDDDPRVTTLAIPGYRQTRSYTCGYAASLMVAHFFYPHLPGRELYRSLGTSHDGTRQSAIVRELRGTGVRANVRYDCDFDRYATEIGRGKPIIGYLDDADHWLVIYGIGLDPLRLYVADPRPRESCEHLWSEYGHRLAGFGIVCSSAAPAQVAAPEREPRPAPEEPRPGPILLPPSPLARRPARTDDKDVSERADHEQLPLALGGHS